MNSANKGYAISPDFGHKNLAKRLAREKLREIISSQTGSGLLLLLFLECYRDFLAGLCPAKAGQNRGTHTEGWGPSTPPSVVASQQLLPSRISKLAVSKQWAVISCC
jgi:hypothetical protein